jgi:hypothetical protein
MDCYLKPQYSLNSLEYLIKNSRNQQKSNDFDYLSLTQQGKITPNNREQLVIWVLETCEVHRTHKKTEQLAISYIDTFLKKKSVSQVSLLELIGYVCIALALKYEEGRELTPGQIHELCEGKFSIEVIKTTELYTLSLLEWRMDLPTPSELLMYFLINTCEEFNFAGICKLADGFIAVALADYESVRKGPVVVAVASAVCAMEKGRLSSFGEEWVGMIESKFQVKKEEVWNAAQRICNKINSYTN